MILQSEYDAIVRQKRLKVFLIILPVFLVVVFFVWLYIESKKIKPAFKDEATKKAYEQTQIESSFQAPEEPEVKTYTEEELKTQKPEIYHRIQFLQPPSTDNAILKK